MSDNTFTTAPIGGGKSLRAVMRICSQLEKTEHGIVTNVPIILYLPSTAARLNTLADYIAHKRKPTRTDEQIYWTLQEYAQAFIKAHVDVAQRVCYLNEERSREFYRYMPKMGFDLTPEQIAASGIEPWRDDEDEERASFGWKLPMRPHPQYKWLCDFRARSRPKLTDPVCGLLNCGIEYHMDEFHKLYPIRSMQVEGDRQLEDYESELRKLDDNLWKYSQHPEKVLKNCRRNATQWIEVRNMSKQPLLMGVTLKNQFRERVFMQAEMPAKTDNPTMTIKYNRETSRRYEFLYRTLQGSSIAGGAPGVVAETSDFRGRSPYWYVVLFLAIVAGAYLLPRVVQGAVRTVVHGVVGGVGAGVSQGIQDSIAVKVPAKPVTVVNRVGSDPAVGAFHPLPFQPGQIDRQVLRAAVNGDVSSELHVTGVWMLGTSNQVLFLSDGTELEGDEVIDVGRYWAKTKSYGKIKRDR